MPPRRAEAFAALLAKVIAQSAIALNAGAMVTVGPHSLSERTRHVVREKFGDAVRLHSRIFVSDETSADYEQLRGPMREQVIQLLTGLSESRLKELGVVEFRNPASDEAVA